MIQRELFESFKTEVLKDEPHKNVLLVEGARQVGKTHLIESVLASIKDSLPICSFNLEKDLVLQNELSQAQTFQTILDAFIKRGYDEKTKSILFIDEAQESENLGNFVRFFKEDLTDQTVIVSGSSLSRLFANSRYPVGRVKKFRINPFNFREYLLTLQKENLIPSFARLEEGVSDVMHLELLKLYDEYLNIGGMPSVVSSPLNERDEQRMLIYFSQEEDFYRKLPKFRKDLFRGAMQVTANLLGSPFSYSKVSDNHRMVKDIMSELDAWKLVHMVEQRNPNSTTSFHPKVYLYDVGLARHLKFSGVSSSVGILQSDNVMIRNAIGGLIENSVLLELTSGLGYLKNITGWKRSSDSDKEVDFISNGNLPIEVKATLKIQNKHLRGIVEYLKLYDLEKGVVISGDKFKVLEVDAKKIINLPVYGVVYASEL